MENLMSHKKIILDKSAPNKSTLVMGYEGVHMPLQLEHNYFGNDLEDEVATADGPKLVDGLCFGNLGN